MLSTTFALQATIDESGLTWGLAGVIVGSMLALFSMWWLYFEIPGHTHLTTQRTGFVWGYGHYALFAAVAAVGAGIAAVVANSAADHGDPTAHHLSTVAAGAIVAIPAGIFVLVTWALLLRAVTPKGLVAAAVFLTLTLLAVSTLFSTAVLLIGGGLAFLAPVVIFTARRSAEPSAHSGHPHG